jgi:hypothetical protein
MHQRLLVIDLLFGNGMEVRAVALAVSLLEPIQVNVGALQQRLVARQLSLGLGHRRLVRPWINFRQQIIGRDHWPSV